MREDEVEAGVLRGAGGGGFGDAQAEARSVPASLHWGLPPLRPETTAGPQGWARPRPDEGLPPPRSAD